MSINPPTVNDLGVIITSARLRRAIYSTYVIALIAAGATQIAFAALDAGQPRWLVATLAVLAYLGIPVATLAVANTAPAAARTILSAVVPTYAAPVVAPAPAVVTTPADPDQPAAGTEPVAASAGGD